jgi:D-aspartate ligase
VTEVAGAHALVFPDNLAALATCRELGWAGITAHLLGPRRVIAARSRHARFVASPDFYSDPEAFVDFACRFAASLDQPPVLFPTEDAALLLADRHHDALSRHCRYPYAAPGVATRLLDKRDLYAAAARAGVGAPRFVDVDDADACTTLSTDVAWLVKPPCRYRFDEQGKVRTFLSITGGAKALGRHLATDVATVRRAGFPAVVQERIPGDFDQLVSVGLCMDRDGRLLDSFTARKRFEYPEPFGDGLVVERVTDPGVTEPALRLLRELGYWGICDVEFKRDARDGIFKVLDANPRTWLWAGLGRAGGNPLVLTAYNLVAEQPIACPPIRERRDAVWVSPRGTAAFLLKSYRARRHGPFLPLRLTGGALRTILRDFLVYYDPLYLRPSAWLDMGTAVMKRGRATTVKHPVSCN